MRILPVSILCLVLLVATGRLPAQTVGVLEGTVHDPAGVVVAGAAVRITEAGTGAERQLTTGDRGRFLAPGLAPGIYEIEVVHPGLRPEIRRGIVLAAGRSVRADFHLELGETRAAIEVVAELPLVSTSASDWGSSVDRQSLEALPLNGRDLYDLSSQEPGAAVPRTAVKSMVAGLGAHVSVHGARPNQNSFRLDGIYINDATGVAPASAAGRLLGVEGIHELRLVTSPFSAEFGRAAGAVLTAVSKSGTNDLRGSVYEYFRNSALDAKNFFDLPDQKIPPLRKNQFGALLGGPLRRDRAFFLLNYEGIREAASGTERPVTMTAEARSGRLPGLTVAVAPSVRPYLDLYPMPNGREFGDGTAEFITGLTTRVREDHIAGKVDLLVSERMRFSSRYTFDDARKSTPDPFRIWDFLNLSRYHFIHTETQYIQSAATIHDFRAGFSRVRNAEEADLPADLSEALTFVRGEPLGAIRVTGLSELGGIMARGRPRRNAVTDFQLNQGLTHIRGAHVVRFGAGYNRVHYNQIADINAGGFYRFDSVADFLLARPRSADLMMPGSDSVRGWRQHLFFFFVQDEYRLGPRLSLNAGVRYETYSVPAEVQGKVATLRDPWNDTEMTLGGPLFRNPSRKNFGPRASIAWDPLGLGTTVIRAGAGIFFDLLGTREVVIAGVRVPPFFDRALISAPGFPDLLSSALDVRPPSSLDGLDYHQKQPYVAKFQMTVERQLGREIIAQAGYSGARGIHLPGQLGNINPPRPVPLEDGRLFFGPSAPRLNPYFDRIGIRRMEFNSFYHAFHAAIHRRWRGGLRVQAKYTWAKSIDETSSTILGDFVNSDSVPTIFDYRQNRGPSDFDVRHLLAANFSWRLPEPAGAAAGKVLGGWELHGLAQAQTGHPFNPAMGFDQTRLLGSNDLGQRPDFIAAPGSRVVLGGPDRYFDPLAFGLPPAGTYGNLGRNTLTGPSMMILDLELHKTLWATERHNLRLRAEAFNVANRPNFQIPSELALFNNRLARLGSAGRITETSTAARQIQLAIRWDF